MILSLLDDASFAAEVGHSLIKSHPAFAEFYHVVSLSLLETVSLVAEVECFLTRSQHVAAECLPLLLHAFLLSCLLYTSPSPRDATLSRMPSSA